MFQQSRLGNRVHAVAFVLSGIIWCLSHAHALLSLPVSSISDSGVGLPSEMRRVHAIGGTLSLRSGEKQASVGCQRLPLVLIT